MVNLLINTYNDITIKGSKINEFQILIRSDKETELFKTMMKVYEDEAKGATHDLDSFLHVVCEHLNIEKSLLMAFNSKRNRDVVFVRQIAMVFSFSVLKYTTTQAGAIFGKDHSTATHAKNQIRKLYATIPHVRTILVNLGMKLNIPEKDFEETILGGKIKILC